MILIFYADSRTIVEAVEAPDGGWRGSLLDLIDTLPEFNAMSVRR